jgi:hypothetical protein
VDVIVGDADFDFVCRTFDKFDPRLVPHATSQAEKIAYFREALDAMATITFISGFLTDPEQNAEDPEVAYRTKFYTILIDRWPDIVRWMHFWLFGPAINLKIVGGSSKIIATACHVINTIVRGAQGIIHLEEVATAPCTLNLLFLLLCKRDDVAPRRHCSSEWTPGRRTCNLFDLFTCYFNWPIGWIAIEGYLFTMPNSGY